MDIIPGTIDLKSFEMTLIDQPNSQVVKVRRTTNNVKKRPNAANRHQNHLVGEQNINSLNFINPTDLEWMSLNYRKERAA